MAWPRSRLAREGGGRQRTCARQLSRDSGASTLCTAGSSAPAAAAFEATATAAATATASHEPPGARVTWVHDDALHQEARLDAVDAAAAAAGALGLQQRRQPPQLLNRERRQLGKQLDLIGPTRTGTIPKRHAHAPIHRNTCCRAAGADSRSQPRRPCPRQPLTIPPSPHLHFAQLEVHGEDRARLGRQQPLVALVHQPRRPLAARRGGAGQARAGRRRRRQAGLVLEPALVQPHAAARGVTAVYLQLGGCGCTSVMRAGEAVLMAAVARRVVWCFVVGEQREGEGHAIPRCCTPCHSARALGRLYAVPRRAHGRRRNTQRRPCMREAGGRSPHEQPGALAHVPAHHTGVQAAPRSVACSHPSRGLTGYGVGRPTPRARPTGLCAPRSTAGRPRRACGRPPAPPRPLPSRSCQLQLLGGWQRCWLAAPAGRWVREGRPPGPGRWGRCSWVAVGDGPERRNLCLTAPALQLCWAVGCACYPPWCGSCGSVKLLSCPSAAAREPRWLRVISFPSQQRHCHQAQQPFPLAFMCVLEAVSGRRRVADCGVGLAAQRRMPQE